MPCTRGICRAKLRKPRGSSLDFLKRFWTSPGSAMPTVGSLVHCLVPHSGLGLGHLLMNDGDDDDDDDAWLASAQSIHPSPLLPTTEAINLIHPFFLPSFHPSIQPTIHPSILPSIHLSIHPSISVASDD